MIFTLHGYLVHPRIYVRCTVYPAIATSVPKLTSQLHPTYLMWKDM